MANKEKNITVSDVRRWFDYDHLSGRLIWRARPPSDFKKAWVCRRWNKCFPGNPAGYLDPLGYVVISIDSVRYQGHRLIWAWCKGVFPEGEIDHVDHDRANNRIENLRDVSVQVNQRNTKRSKANTSGQTGVVWYKNHKKWGATIKVDGKNTHLGSFDDIADAVLARKNAELHYGFHRNHGKITTGV